MSTYIVFMSRIKQNPHNITTENFVTKKLENALSMAKRWVNIENKDIHDSETPLAYIMQLPDEVENNYTEDRLKAVFRTARIGFIFEEYL